MRPAVTFTLALLLAACARTPRFEPIPEQVPPVEAPDPPSTPCFFSMSDPRSDQFIVTGIPTGPGAGVRRWTNEQPAVRCKLPTAGPWLVAMDFVAIESTMRDTGPITLTFTANGKEIAHLRCQKDGERQFRAPLPAELGVPGTEIVLQATIDKPWVSPSDGAKLGVLLSAMGLLQP